MPVIRCKPKNQYYNMLITGGPRPRDQSIRQDLMQAVVDHYGDKITECKVAEEISKEGYYHFHIMLDLKSPQRFTTLSKLLINLLKKYPKDLNEARDFNCGVYYCTDKLRAKTILTEYLQNPVKDKLTDDNILEYDAKNFVNNNICHPTDALQADRAYMDFMYKNFRHKPVFHRFSCKCILCEPETPHP